MADLPQDLFEHQLFPVLPLSKVIELTEIRPDLLPKTKKYILKLGETLGMKNISDSRQVLKNLHLSKTLDEIFQEFCDFFYNDIFDFVLSWVDDVTYETMNREEILSEWEIKLEQMYPIFMKDMNQNVDTVFGKIILHPKVYFSNKGSSEGIFQKMFSNLYDEFYHQLKLFFTETHFSDHFDPKTFIPDDHEIHQVIKANTSYNADRLFYSMFFQ